MKRTCLALAGVVVGSLLLSARAGTSDWWTETFSEGSMNVLTNTTGVSDGTRVYGTWTSSAEDQSHLENSYSNQCLSSYYEGTAPTDVLVLNTEGTEFTFTPADAVIPGDVQTNNTVIVDADVFFVGSESAPQNLGNDVQFALFLQVPEDGTAGSTNVMVYVDDDGTPAWTALADTAIADKTWHHVQVKIDYGTRSEGVGVNVFIDGVDKTPQDGLKIANGKRTATQLNSVSFRGTGAVDNFTGKLGTVDVIPTHTFTADAYADGVLDQTIVIDSMTVAAGSNAEFEVAKAVDGKTIEKLVVYDFVGETNATYWAENNFAGLSVNLEDDDYAYVTVSTVGSATTGSAQTYPTLHVYYVTPPPPTYSATITPPTGCTVTGVTVNGTAVTAATTITDLVDDDVVVFTYTNADGVSKTASVTINGDDATVDESAATFTWTDYLGAADAGAYKIDDAADLEMFRKGVASGLATTGETFKQTADIDMTSAGAFAGVGSYVANPTGGTAFAGTYDGQGYKIKNIDFTQRNYGGVFNQVNGGTIKNLTVSNITCSAYSSGEFGFAIVGNAGNGATLTNLVAEGVFASASQPATHNIAGIVVRASAGANTLVKDCVNNATLYGAYTKAAGICALTQTQVSGGAVTFDGCVNNGAVVMDESKVVDNSKHAGQDGLAGIVGYIDCNTTLKDCENTGSLSSTYGSARVGQLIGFAYRNEITDNGGNKAPASAKMIAYKNPETWQDKNNNTYHTTITGFQYATVADGVATTISGSPVAGGIYLLEGDAAPTVTLSAGQSVTFDTALGYTLTETGITAPGNVLLTSTSGTAKTFTAAAPVATVVSGGTTTSYATLAAAVAAAQSGDTVTLLGNVTLDARVEPTVSMTIDLGGHTITRTGTSGNGSAFDVKGGNVVITNGVIDCTQDDTLIAADGVYAITSRSGSNVTLADLTITVDSECGACAYPFAGSTMTIESGTYSNITQTPYRYNTAITGMAVNQPNIADQLLTINGGSFSQYDPQLGDDSGNMTDFTDDGFVAIDDGHGHFVVQAGYNVTFDANGGSPAPDAQRVTAGGTATEPTEPTKEGYTFDGWFAAGASEAFDFDTVLDADIVLTASWTEAPAPVETPAVDIGGGLAAWNAEHPGEEVAPVKIDSTGFKASFVAPVSGYYYLMTATAPAASDEAYAADLGSGQFVEKDAVGTLVDDDMTATKKFYKIGFSATEISE